MARYTLFYIIFLLSYNLFGQNVRPNADLIFDLNDEIGNEVLYSKYANDSLSKNIETIRFVGFDSIPNKFILFKNVNTIILESSDVNGLDIFPLLETLYLIESGKINEQESWLKRIKKLNIHKTYSIEGITSFKNIPLLEELVLSYSGFYDFPSNIDSLKNIKKIIWAVYTGTKIDLSLIDLNKIPSLKELEVISWSNNIIGIPIGIKNSHLQRLKIQHPNLTPEEKRNLLGANQKMKQR